MDIRKEYEPDNVEMFAIRKRWNINTIIDRLRKRKFNANMTTFNLHSSFIFGK